MFNLRKRIKELQENTASLEAKSICKELLENFSNLPDSQISAVMVEKMKAVSDADKHVRKFVQVVEKVDAVNNLGVAKGIALIKESQIYSYPALKYGIDSIENSLITRQVRVVENEAMHKDFKAGDTWSSLKMGGGFRLETSNTAGKPEYMVIDATLECLKNFVWDEVVGKVYADLKTKRTDLSESIDIAISINGMVGNKGSFFFDSVIPKLEEHFINPTENSRTSIIESLRKMNFYPVAKKLSESLARVQQAGTKGVQIVSDNTKCEVSSIYSPILLENGTEYFFVKGNFYGKSEGKILKITEEAAKALPEKFTNVCRIVSSPNVFIKEGKISFYLKRNKVEILENEGAVSVLFNGSKVTSNELAKNMVSAGLFRLEESKIAYDVQTIAEAFSNIYDLDFGKLIESKIHAGSYVILMKNGDNIYLNKVNESMRSNEFFSDLNATQARNKIMEFIGFDIKESMSEYLEKDEVKLQEMREQQSEIVKHLSIVEANLTKVTTTLQDAFMSKSPELSSLKRVLEEEISKLRNDHRSISDKIRAFENKGSDAGFESGDEVKLVDSGDSATVVSVDSSTDSVTVVTSKGKTISVPISKVISQEAEIAKAETKNENEKADEEDEEEEVKTVKSEEVTDEDGEKEETEEEKETEEESAENTEVTSTKENVEIVENDDAENEELKKKL